MCSWRRERPTRPKPAACSGPDLALGVSGRPQLLELVLQVANPGRHRREPGPHDGRPGCSGREGSRRRRLITHAPVEDDEVEDHRLQSFRDELMIEHPYVDADLTLCLGDLQERLVAG